MPPPAARFAGRDGPLRLLVVGGSLGAQALNELVPAAIARLAPDTRPVVVHQAGEKHIAALRELYAKQGVQAECVAFIDDMAARYAWADFVICRGGGGTVAELMRAGRAAIIVPYPHHRDRQQPPIAHQKIGNRDHADRHRRQFHVELHEHRLVLRRQSYSNKNQNDRRRQMRRRPHRRQQHSQQQPPSQRRPAGDMPLTAALIVGHSLQF